MLISEELVLTLPFGWGEAFQTQVTPFTEAVKHDTIVNDRA